MRHPSPRLPFSGPSPSTSWHRWRRLARVGLAVAGLAAAGGDLPGARAASVAGPLLSVEQLAGRASVILVGEVVAVRGEWDATRTVITTAVDVRPAEVLKGSAGPLLRVRHLGGRIGELTSVVAGSPTFAVGERVLLFLAARPGGELGLVESFQGKFTLTRDAAGREVAVRAPVGSHPRDEVPLDEARASIHGAGGR